MSDTPLHAIIDAGSDQGPVLVLLHGRGSDERDLLPLGRLLHPQATTISVRAPFAAAPWGYGPGYAWYRFLGGTVPESASFEAGQLALREFIDALPARLGRAHFPLIIGGFSQGGVSALAFMLRNPERAAAILVFSGFLADHPSVRVTRERVGATPIFWGHGMDDVMIPFEAAEAGWAALRAADTHLESHAYPDMGHTISEAELRDAARWLAHVLDDENANGAVRAPK